MEEHKKFLADRILSEERPITYRLLSRALDVHVNTAKEMLYDYYKYQNALKAKSVFATYLVYGTKAASLDRKHGDVEMSSSPPEQYDLSDPVPSRAMILAEEEKLNALLAQLTEVSSIHIYSLAPHPQRDLQLLSDVATSISDYAKSDNAATKAQKYGTITNAHAQRRERKQKNPAGPATLQARPIKTESATPKPSSTAPKVKQETAAPKETAPSSNAVKSKPPALKRDNSSGIMQSFAKAASKPKKPSAVVKKEEDVQMALSDDGEADEYDLPPQKKAPAETEAARKSRKQREDDLRQMMEEDDEEKEEDKSDGDGDGDGDGDEEMQEPDAEPVLEPEAEKVTEKEPEVVVASTGDGRRRGRRQVMKKKRMLDEQGYMVTIQEKAWESFSEDDGPASLKKEATPSTDFAPASSGAKSKKSLASKGSQGNIMSFFSKK